MTELVERVADAFMSDMFDASSRAEQLDGARAAITEIFNWLETPAVQHRFMQAVTDYDNGRASANGCYQAMLNQMRKEAGIE